MLIDLLLEDKGQARIIGAPMPTIKLWAKVDGILSIMPKENDPSVSELNVIGLPGTVTCVESPESLAERINVLYGKLQSTGSFIKFGSKGGPSLVDSN